MCATNSRTRCQLSVAADGLAQRNILRCIRKCSIDALPEPLCDRDQKLIRDFDSCVFPYL